MVRKNDEMGQHKCWNEIWNYIWKEQKTVAIVYIVFCISICYLFRHCSVDVRNQIKGFQVLYVDSGLLLTHGQILLMASIVFVPCKKWWWPKAAPCSSNILINVFINIEIWPSGYHLHKLTETFFFFYLHSYLKLVTSRWVTWILFLIYI